MKTIRNGVFETNSSSTHSLTMCTESDFKKWKNGELYLDKDSGEFVTLEERIKRIKELIIYSRMDYNNGTYTYKGISATYKDKDEKFYTPENLAEITEQDVEEYLDGDYDSYEVPMTCDEYNDTMEYETYQETFTTPNGEKVVAFGYYGNNY